MWHCCLLPVSKLASRVHLDKQRNKEEQANRPLIARDTKTASPDC